MSGQNKIILYQDDEITRVSVRFAAVSATSISK